MYKKIVLFILSVVIFSGCSQKELEIFAKVMVRDMKRVHNGTYYQPLPKKVEKRMPFIAEGKPLTGIEDNYIETLPLTYFDNSTWQGYVYWNNGDTSFLKLRMKEVQNENLLNQQTFLQHITENSINDCVNFSLTLPLKGFFLIEDKGNSCVRPEKFKIVFKRGQIDSNTINARIVDPQYKNLGFVTFQRKDPFPYIAKKQLKQNHAKSLILEENYSSSNDSNIYLKVNSNEHDAFVKRIQAQALNKNIVITVEKKELKIWDINKNHNIDKILFQIARGNTGEISSFDISSNKKHIAVSGIFDGPSMKDRGSVYLLDSKNKKIKNRFFTNSDDVIANLQFSEDSRYLFGSTASGFVYIWKVNSGKLLKKIDFVKDEKDKLLFSRLKVKKAFGDYKIYVSFNQKLKKYSFTTGNLEAKYIGHFSILDFDISKNEVIISSSDSQLSFSTKKKELYLLDTNLKIKKPIAHGEDYPISFVKFNKNGSELILVSKNLISVNKKSNRFRANKTYKIKEGFISALALNKDDLLLINPLKNKMFTFDLNSMEKKKEIGNNNLSKMAAVLDENSISFKRYSLLENDKLYELDKELFENSFDLELKKFNKINKTYSKKNFEKHSSLEIKKLDTGDIDLYEKSFFSKKKVARIKKDEASGKAHFKTLFYKDYLISSGYNEISVYNKKGVKVANLYGQDGLIVHLDLYKDRLISTSSDKSISLWNLSKLQENVKTLNPLVNVLIDNKNEWIMWTPQGYFDSSEQGYKYIGFHLNKGYKKKASWIGIDKLYDHFYRPDLVKLALRGEDINKYTKGLSFQDVLKNPPPKVKILNKTKTTRANKIKINFNVEQVDNGGIGLIRVYQEGKLVRTIGNGKVNKQLANVIENIESKKLEEKAFVEQKKYLENLEEIASKSMEGNVSSKELLRKTKFNTSSNVEGLMSLELPLKTGRNTIEIEAFNKTNTVASIREKIQINAKIKKRKPKVYAIVAGVNDFEKNKRFKNLKYSQNDAKAIKRILKNKIKEKVEVSYLVGKDLTKKNLLKTVEKIKAKAHLEDKIVFYISTHGKAIKGNLYLIPQNNKLAKNWIKFEDLFKEIQSINALEQIFIIDACESGKAKDIVASIYDSKASVLAKSSGVHILLATTKGTFAFEHPNPNIKHGVFTNNILKALNSRSTDKNRDSKISVIELSKVLKDPKFISKEQYPVIRNVGYDTKLRDF